MMKSRIARFFTTILSTSLVLALAAQGVSAQTMEQTWGKISFQTALPFSPPLEIGLDAVALIHPPESGMGEEQMEITLARVSQVVQENMNNNDEEVIAYIKTTFFGLTDPASTSVVRIFQGQQITGQSQSIDFPNDAELEYFLVPLADGSKIFVAFKWALNFSREQVEEIISAVSLSFRETE